jgi:hypothetical protein
MPRDYLINKEEGSYCCIAEAGKKLSILHKWRPIGNHPITEVFKTKSILAFNLADPRYKPIVQLLGQGLTAVLYAPITDAKGNIIACLGTASSDESAMSKGIAGLFKEASGKLCF